MDALTADAESSRSKTKADKKREHNRTYRAANKDRVKQWNKKYYAAHADAMKASMQRTREKHKVTLDAFIELCSAIDGANL